MKGKLIAGTALAAGSVIVAITAFAQSHAAGAPGMPGTPGTSSAPGTAGNPLDALPRIVAPRTPGVSVQVHTQPSALTQLLASRITPQRFQVEGVHSLPFAEVAARFAPLAGHEVTLQQIIDTASGVTALYQARGYALSFAFVPKQDFHDGSVRITVVEGYVANVTLRGDAGNLDARIRAIAAHITAERPLRRATFERYVNVLGMLPGVQVKASVPAPATTDGATTLALDVTRKRINLGAGLDFNHPGVLGVLSATENGLTPLGEQLGISTIVPRGRDNIAFVTAHGALPLGSDGLTFRLDASHYRGNPVDTPGLPSYVGRTVLDDKLGASLSYPLLLENNRSVTGTLSFYAAHDENDYANTITNAQYGLGTQIRVLQLQADYAQSENGQTRRANLSVYKGLNLLGASSSIDTNIAGLDAANPASTTFFKTTANYAQTNDWPLGLGTAIALTGQYSPVSLPVSEQITFGAQRFAQGYEPGEAAGDSGWAAAFELNRAIHLGKPWLQTLTPYVSFDIARVYLHAGTPEPSRLSSASAGFRVSDGKHYTLDLSVARALADAPVEDTARSPRINVTFSYQLN